MGQKALDFLRKKHSAAISYHILGQTGTSVKYGKRFWLCAEHCIWPVTQQANFTRLEMSLQQNHFLTFPVLFHTLVSSQAVLNHMKQTPALTPQLHLPLPGASVLRMISWGAELHHLGATPGRPLLPCCRQTFKAGHQRRGAEPHTALLLYLAHLLWSKGQVAHYL